MKKVMFVAAALTSLVITVGCGAPNQTSSQVNPSTSPIQGAQSVTTPAPAVALKMQHISLTILPGARLGPDGKLHDTFTTPDFTVVQGVPVQLSIYNYDSGAHSLTSSDLSLNVQAKGSPKDGVPGITTVTFTPSKTGDFNWQCIDACDTEAGGWAMSHPGYMEGTIRVVPYANKQYIDLTIKDGLQYAAADGKLHDSYSPADFTVQAGIPVQVTVENFDQGSHSFTSADLGVNQIFKAAPKAGQPSVTIFTFTPASAGSFTWHCVLPCDDPGWAMSHDGYMMGTVTVQS